MALVRRRNPAIERDQQQNLANLPAVQPLLSAPLTWTRSSLARPIAAVMATAASDFVLSGSPGRLQMSP